MPIDQGTVLLWLTAALAALCVAALVYALVRAIFGSGSHSLVGSIRRGRSGSMAVAQGGGSWLARLSRTVGRRFPAGSLRLSLLQRYQAAGWPGDWDDDRLVGFSLLLGVPIAAAAVGGLLIARPLLAPVGLAGWLLGMGAVSLYLSGKAQQREAEISAAMPFVMDMMAMSIQAGASTQMTMQRVARDYADHPIGEEFTAVLADVRSGATFSQAVQRFRDRLPVREIEVFADDVVQSERMGRPLAETLAHSSSRFKTMRIQSARGRAGRAKVMILLPATLVLFAGLIVLFAPFAIKFLRGEYGG